MSKPNESEAPNSDDPPFFVSSCGVAAAAGVGVAVGEEFPARPAGKFSKTTLYVASGSSPSPPAASFAASYRRGKVIHEVGV